MSLIQHLLDLGHERFVIRLMGKVHVEGDRYRGLLSHHPLRPGESVVLGWCRLRSDAAVSARVVGVWKRGKAEPWWLATAMAVPAEKVVSLYDRRTSIEEHFRDSKGARYGAQIKWTHFQRPESLGRLRLLLGIALIAWTAAGILATRRDETLLWMSRSEGARRSYVTIGVASRSMQEVVLVLPWSEIAKLIPQAVFRSPIPEEKSEKRSDRAGAPVVLEIRVLEDHEIARATRDAGA